MEISCNSSYIWIVNHSLCSFFHFGFFCLLRYRMIAKCYCKCESKEPNLTSYNSKNQGEREKRRRRRRRTIDLWMVMMLKWLTVKAKLVFMERVWEALYKLDCLFVGNEEDLTERSSLATTWRCFSKAGFGGEHYLKISCAHSKARKPLGEYTTTHCMLYSI